MRRASIVVFLTAIAWTHSLAAAAFREGDVVVAGYVGDGVFAPAVGKIREFAPDGSLVQEFSKSAFDLKFSPAGVLHGASGGGVIRIASDGTLLTPLLAPTPEVLHWLAFNRAGELFAATPYGSVVRFGGDGSARGTIMLPGVSNTEGIDLGGDQCTLYYLRRPPPQIGRYDVCTNTSLAPLPTVLGDTGRTLLVLVDGTLFVTGFHGDMYRISADGTVLRHYATHALAYARDANPNFIWITTGASSFAKFDLQNDVLAAGPFNAGVDDITGIAIVGADVQSIPILTPYLLVFFGFVLACAAALRLRT